MKKRILSSIFAAFMLGASVIGLGACGETPTSAGTPGNETEQGGETNPGEGGTENQPQGGESQGGAHEVRTTVTEEEWRAALRMEGVRNVTMTIDVELNDNGISQHYYAIGKIDEDNWYYRQEENEVASREEYYQILETLSGNMDYMYPGLPDVPRYPETEYAENIIYLANVYTMANDQWTLKTDSLSWVYWQMGESFVIFEKYFEQFTYNSETAQYEANGLVLTDEDGEQEIEGEFIYQFENGKITKFEVRMQIQTDAYETDHLTDMHWYMTFSDYGTTNVTLPQVAEE